jgi:putative transcriptional regulator
MTDPRVGPIHHPSEAYLLDYASGALREPMALLVASHLALCPRCRRETSELQAVGGALLEELPPEPVAGDSLSRLFARLDRADPDSERAVAEPPAVEPLLPRPLRDYVDGPLDRLTWRRFGPIAEARLLTSFAQFTTRLLKIEAGGAMPRHSHTGNELSLVLQGGFSDITGHYLRGDVCELDREIDHRPIADRDEDCLCLSVTDAPLRLTGWFGRLINPFIRI